MIAVPILVVLGLTAVTYLLLTTKKDKPEPEIPPEEDDFDTFGLPDIDAD